MRSLTLCAIAFLSAVCSASPASAQFGPCASMSDPVARLQCYDRQSNGSPQSSGRPAPPASIQSGSCTRSSPCVGPRGGVYYFTPSGNKRYLPR